MIFYLVLHKRNYTCSLYERGGTKKRAGKGKAKATAKKVVMHFQLQNLPCDTQCKCQDSKKEKGTFDIHVGSAPKRDGPPEVIIIQ